MLIWWFFRRQIEKHLKIDCVVEKIEFFRLFMTRYCCGISLRSSRRRIFLVDDLYHIQYWRILIKRELVRLLSTRRVNKCQISKLYVYSLTLDTFSKLVSHQNFIDHSADSYDCRVYSLRHIIARKTKMKSRAVIDHLVRYNSINVF
jgi:hypothetical protein